MTGQELAGLTDFVEACSTEEDRMQAIKLSISRVPNAR
jgi:hypothetical protein